jgi:hypothetical protein
MDYPAQTVTLEQLLEHFEEDTTAGTTSQWKAKGDETNIDIELVPKGTGIVKTSSDMEVADLNADNVVVSDNVYAREFVELNSGTISYDVDGLVDEIAITGGRTMTITRNGDGTINTVSDGTYIWTYSYTDGVITSWSVAEV